MFLDSTWGVATAVGDIGNGVDVVVDITAAAAADDEVLFNGDEEDEEEEEEMEAEVVVVMVVGEGSDGLVAACRGLRKVT